MRLESGVLRAFKEREIGHYFLFFCIDGSRVRKLMTLYLIEQLFCKYEIFFL